MILWLSAVLFSVASAEVVCIADPPDFVWNQNNSGYMEMITHVLSFPRGNVQVRAWKDAANTAGLIFPPPTIRMRRGETFKLYLRNSLPEGPTSTEHNVYKDPNVINIHTHGLHISGETPADDVTRAIGFEECAEYIYDIPEEHLGGTHFYHPHHHGSTYLQTAGGAVGMLIIEDDEEFDQIPALVSQMEEREFLISFMEKGASGVGGDTIFWQNDDGITTVRGNDPIMMINGIELGHGEICVPNNTWQRWRIHLFEPRSNFYQFALTDGNGGAALCEMALMARDGIWRTETPKALTNNTYFLPASSRADIAVRCTGHATMTLQHYVPREDTWDPYFFVTNITVDPNLPTNSEVGPYSQGAAGTTWSSRRPDYAPVGLAQEDAAGMDHKEFLGVTRNAGFSIQTGNPSEIAADHISQMYNYSRPGGTYGPDWKVEFSPMKSGDHSFHMHIWPITPVSFNTGQGDCGALDYEIGEYYDVWRCEGNTRHKTVRFGGKTIAHCHMVFHEDLGLMTWFNVTGGERPDNSCPERNLYTCSSVFNDLPSCASNSPTPGHGPTPTGSLTPTPGPTPTPTPGPSPTPTGSPTPSPPTGCDLQLASADLPLPSQCGFDACSDDVAAVMGEGSGCAEATAVRACIAGLTLNGTCLAQVPEALTAYLECEYEERCSSASLLATSALLGFLVLI